MLIDRKVGDSISWWSEDYFFPGVKVVHFKDSSKGTKKVTASKINVSAKTKDLQIKSGIDAKKMFYKKFCFYLIQKIRKNIEDLVMYKSYFYYYLLIML